MTAAAVRGVTVNKAWLREALSALADIDGARLMV